MYTKGADPELFLRNKTTGDFISSVGLIGGSKDFPMPIGQGCYVQEDNVTVEFNIPPCKSVDDFIRSINYNKEYITKRAEELGLELCIQPSANFSDEQLATPAAQTFGCDPDFNAWNDGQQNPRPFSEEQNLRSAGGHIHVELPDSIDRLEVVKAMDLFVSCQMLKFDNDTKRRTLYGKPGSFRHKPYGVEYRTASNAWIRDNETIAWAWFQTEKAVEFVKNGGSFSKEQGLKIQRCINESTLELLEELNKEFGL